MKTVQEMLHTLEVGRGKLFIQGALLVVGFLFVGFLYYTIEYRGFDKPEAMDVAQLARNIARGEGYTTSYVRPIVLGMLRERADAGEGPAVEFAAVPEILRAPLYPYTLGYVFKLTKTRFDETPQELGKAGYFRPERTVLGLNTTLFLLTTAVLFLWALRMFDHRVAIVSALVLGLTDLLWQFTMSGLPLLMSMFLVTCSCAALHEGLLAEEEERMQWVWLWLPVAGLMAGLAVLSNLILGGFAAALGLVAIVAFRRRLLPALLAVAIAAAVVAPWLIRNYSVSGNPLGANVHLVRAMPAELGASDVERTLNASGYSGLVNMAGSKVLRGTLYQSTHGFELLGGSLAVMFFVAALMHPFRRRRAQVMRILVLLAAGALIGLTSLFVPKPEAVSDANLLPVILPGVVAFGVAFFYILLDRLNIGILLLRYLVLIAFVVVCAAPLILTLLPPGRNPFNYPPYFPPMIRFASEWINPNEAMMSDMPWATAWYGDRRSFLLPTSVDEFLAVNDEMQLISGLLMTPVSWNQPLREIDKGSYKDWAMLIRRQGLPKDFTLPATVLLPPLENDYVFFSDRRRW